MPDSSSGEENVQDEVETACLLSAATSTTGAMSKGQSVPTGQFEQQWIYNRLKHIILQVYKIRMFLMIVKKKRREPQVIVGEY